MSRLRLALVTRRFWPLVGGAEMVMSNLAVEFRRQGHDVTIVTAQWQPTWPTEVVHREVPVVRLPNPPQRAWGTLRYMLALTRWLKSHATKLDAVYVSMLKHDAYSAIGALAGSRVPVVIRAEGAGETGDCHWQSTARFGLRIRRRCHSADAIVAPSGAIFGELRDAGYPLGRTYQLSNGVAVGAPRSVLDRRMARTVLAESNPDLAVGGDTPVVVYTGRLHEAKGLYDLLRAWPLVLDQFPGARLWIVGDGPARDDLFETILDLDLRHQVQLPGAFDDVQDVLHAADAYVLPSYEEGMSIALLEAMAAGVPVVATDIPGNQALVQHGQHGLLVPPRDPAALASALIQQLAQPRRAAMLAAAAHQRVSNDFSLQRMASTHLDLFQELIARKSGH